ncbi:MAG: DUF4886 domain-containing protein [Bacteroides sp.]|nr:DUF4886 domain-containing protein [Bacteroides sp.]
MTRKLFIILLFFSLFKVGYAAQPLKVLAIGNSFSEDATEQDLSAMAALGGHDIIIGNLYYPACSIERHWNNLTNDRGDYSFRKIYTDGRADTISNCTLTRALREEAWDIITFQQGSAVSGIYSSYRYLPALIKRVRQIVGNHPKFLWHQTWAYAPTSSHPGFKKYSSDQIRMYAAILYCTKRVLADNPELKGLIPTGTAIQDARTSFLGNDLTRDGYHLDFTTGRYIASCTWYGVLFSQPFSIATYLPAGMTLEEGEVCRKAAQEAIKNPYKIVDINSTRPSNDDKEESPRENWNSSEIKVANTQFLEMTSQNLVKRKNIEVNVCLDNIKFVTLRRNVSVGSQENVETFV